MSIPTEVPGNRAEEQVFMEDRLIAALAITVMLIAGVSWAGFRTLAKRRAFRLRQMGRGKSVERSMVD